MQLVYYSANFFFAFLRRVLTASPWFFSSFVRNYLFFLSYERTNSLTLFVIMRIDEKEERKLVFVRFVRSVVDRSFLRGFAFVEPRRRLENV